MSSPFSTIKEVSFDKKNKILHAAEILFSRHGFEGVTTRMLAKEAGVNIAMLSYYFGSKEKLYQATIHNLIEKRQDNLKSIAFSQLEPLEKIYALVDYYVDKVFGEEIAYKIFNQELSNEFSKEGCHGILNYIMGNINFMKLILTEGHEQGVFKKVDLEMTIMTLVSSVNYMNHSSALCQKIFNLNPNKSLFSNESLKKRMKDHLKELMKAHLTLTI